MRPSRLNMMVFGPEHPKLDQNPKFTPLSEMTSIPTPFSPPPPCPGFYDPLLSHLEIPIKHHTFLSPVCFQTEGENKILNRKHP